ncbi:MAG: prolipoprotein diacylglyceryl transferase [Bryobacteraceae bacterium]|nr:prolipoprotein diacylglyceryl transferase [Bryobacteraceae bacterium]
MIPYFEQPVWRVGPLTLHAFGVAAALALVTGYWLAIRRSRAVGLDAALTGRMYVAGALGGLAGGRLFALASSETLSAETLLAFWRGQSTVGLVVGALAVAAGFTWMHGRSALPHLDALALAFPVAWALVRAGCFLAHDHIGPPSASVLAVRFPEGSRLDLGLLEFLAAVATVALLRLLSRARLAPGALFASLLVAAGLTRAGIHALSAPW